MRTCPVCANPVRRLGPSGDPDRGGIVVHTEGATYAVHAACLMAFRDMLHRLEANDALHPATADRDPPERPQRPTLSTQATRAQVL